MEQENEEKETGNAVEASTEAKSSQNKAPKSLKARSKIAKKSPVNDLKTKNDKVTALASPVNDLKTKKGKVTARAWRRIRNKKNKNLLDERKNINSIEEDGSKKLNSREENLKENLSKQKDTKTSQQSQKDQEEIGGSDKNHQGERGEEKIHVSDKSLKNQKDKEKQRDARNNPEKGMRKEKLGGLIFMCNNKTKPDCFHYRVMGVSGGKKDLVLGIKPGLKLFLYDFDLKLLYGIFKATSSGGMKLEPKAFGGAFPAQVRFDIHWDCLPLPESVFKKAIKENYNDKHKFKIEVTPRQVRKLSELFRPAAVHSTALPVLTTPVPNVEDREVYGGVRESNREIFTRGPDANASSRSYNGLSHERGQHITYGKGSSLREEIPRDLYMTEKEYRAYGLQGEGKNLTTNHVAAHLDPYQRGQERGRQHLLRHPDLRYDDTVPVYRKPVPTDPLYLTEREYQTYNVGSRRELPSRIPPGAGSITAAAITLDSYARDPYSTCYYGASSVDPYLPPPRREDVASGSYSVSGRRETFLVGADPLRRAETDQADRLYSSYATSALSNYNRQHHYEGPKPELAAAPVSSRYSFAGPSLSYR